MRGHAQGGRGRRSGSLDAARDRLGETPAAIAAFLRAYSPFDALDPALVLRVAGEAVEECFPAGTTIFSQGTGPVEDLRVVRQGAVEILHDGRLLDLLGPGELFGHASMLLGLPAGFDVRAAETSICYRIPGEEARQMLAGPTGLRFVARSLLEHVGEDVETLGAHRDPASQPVGALLHGAPVVCPPETPIRAVAERMTEAGATSAVIASADGTLGIVTDNDLRTRVLATGLEGGTPVAEVMSAPAYTCASERLRDDVLLEMLDRGIRHFPVVSPEGDVLGVLDDRDLVAFHTRSSFVLRQRIAAAGDVPELVGLAGELRPAVIAMHDAGIAATRVNAVFSVVGDALTRRLLELAVAEREDPPPASFAWLALGSQARREAAPSSDVDSAIVWFGGAGDDAARPYLHELATQVVKGLEACGFAADPNGATASNPVFVRSLESWEHAAKSWIVDPTQEKALILVSVFADSRPVWGVHLGSPVSDTFRLAPRNPELLRLLARFAISHHPPTGFLRGLVVEHTGEHRGRLDLKHGGLLPIVDLARWAAMAAGVRRAGTLERLRVAARAGTLPEADALTLQDAFELITELRLSHQLSQVQAGLTPDDHVDPATLSPLMRSHLKECFRAVAGVQKRVAAELRTGVA